MTKLKFLSCLLVVTLGLSFLTGWRPISAQWQTLNTVPFNGKQDDIFFVNPDIGYYGNGQGFIYKTINGGLSWTPMLHKVGTYVRALGFVDSNLGFAGNIGPGSFPGVTDASPLYQTLDGGMTWNPVSGVTNKQIVGVCSIDVLKTQFINAGHLETRVTLRAAGRVGGPAMMVTSRDLGKTWSAQNLSNLAGMILDVKFVDERVGFICAASHYDIAQSHARILKTNDGGMTWRIVYESNRPYETTWKCSFPTAAVGYATVQNYNPDTSIENRVIAKTIDGGEHWTEVALVKDHTVMEFGVGFIDANIGWIGAMDGGWKTMDGGQSWVHEPMGRAVNKIRVIPSPTGPVIFAIGVDVRKLDLRGSILR